MPNPRRTAPRRRVLQIIKTGHYPNVLHLHRLECDHTEARKRIAATREIGCTACGAISRLSPVTLDTFSQFDEALYDGTRAEVAGALGCDPAGVRVEVDSTGRIRGVQVFLTPDEIQHLKNRTRP